MKLTSGLSLLALALALFFPAAARPANLLWTGTTDSSVQASPVIARDGTVYIGSYDRYIYALNHDGTIKWDTELPEPTFIYSGGFYTAVYGTPAIGKDDALYVPSENGNLLAINPTNGTIKWSYNLNPSTNSGAIQGLYSSVAIGSDDTVYCGSFDTNLYAINPNGTLKWAAPLGSIIFASPVVGHDGTVYCGCNDGKLYALNPTNGVTKWAFNTGPYSIAAAPAIGTNGTLYVGVGSINNPKFYSISTNGATNWIFTAGGRVRSSAALGADGTIYFGCDDSKLYALNPNGTLKWDFTAGGAVGSSPAIAADGTIYFGCDDGNLYAVDNNGNQLWTYASGGPVFASPAIGPDGSVYFASDDGMLYVLEGWRPPMVSAWPMFRHDLERTARAAEASTNLSPVLAAIADRLAAVNVPLIITNLASDANGSGQQLLFSLGLGAPTNATINPTNGVFTWTPTGADLPGTNSIRVVVTDNGVPPLTDVQHFTVSVVTYPQIESVSLSGETVSIVWQAMDARSYRIEYKTNLTDAVWLELAGDVTATGSTATNLDVVSPEARTRFYRVKMLP